NDLPMWTDATHKFGSVLPDFTGGFSNTFRYKNISLAAMITFQSGGQFFSWSRMLSHKTGLAKETAVQNDKGNNVRDPASEGGGGRVTGVSESTGQTVTSYVDARDFYNCVLGTEDYQKFIKNASYIVVSELSLGHTLSPSVVENLSFRSA